MSSFLPTKFRWLCYLSIICFFPKVSHAAESKVLSGKELEGEVMRRLSEVRTLQGLGKTQEAVECCVSTLKMLSQASDQGKDLLLGNRQVEFIFRSFSPKQREAIYKRIVESLASESVTYQYVQTLYELLELEANNVWLKKQTSVTKQKRNALVFANMRLKHLQNKYGQESIETIDQLIEVCENLLSLEEKIEAHKCYMSFLKICVRKNVNKIESLEVASLFIRFGQDREKIIQGCEDLFGKSHYFPFYFRVLHAKSKFREGYWIPENKEDFQEGAVEDLKLLQKEIKEKIHEIRNPDLLLRCWCYFFAGKDYSIPIFQELISCTYDDLISFYCALGEVEKAKSCCTEATEYILKESQVYQDEALYRVYNYFAEKMQSLEGTSWSENLMCGVCHLMRFIPKSLNALGERVALWCSEFDEIASQSLKQMQSRRCMTCPSNFFVGVNKRFFDESWKNQGPANSQLSSIRQLREPIQKCNQGD